MQKSKNKYIINRYYVLHIARATVFRGNFLPNSATQFSLVSIISAAHHGKIIQILRLNRSLPFMSK